MAETYAKVTMQENRLTSYAALFYLLFVIYGSLLPFDFNQRTFAEAWSLFSNIRFLNLGAASRADWIANILLYIPLAYLALDGLVKGGRSQRRYPFMATLAVFIFCVLVSIGIEFTQIFFQPRTVSLNDLIAEFIGTLIGITLWHTASEQLTRLRYQVVSGGPAAIWAAAILYLVAYLAFSLFPYDFVISWTELSAKLNKGYWNPLFTSVGCSEAIRCTAKLGIEVAAVMPIGFLLGMFLGRRAVSGYNIALVAGLLLGAAIEIMQLFVVSGVSQGASILTRAVGMVLGLWLWRSMGFGLSQVRPFFGTTVLGLAIPYLFLLLAANGWFSESKEDLATALLKLEKTQFIPFYYHYYTSEPVAVSSLLMNLVLYAPVGLALWAWSVYRVGSGQVFSSYAAALWGGSIAVIPEAGKLFLEGKHPDPTNLLIAAVAAGITCSIAKWLERWPYWQALREGNGPGVASVGKALPQESPRQEILQTYSVVTHDSLVGTGSHNGSVPDEYRETAMAPSGGMGLFFRRLGALGLFAFIVGAVLNYPLNGWWLAVFLSIYAAILWVRPPIWMLILPALLPTLDLAPWTGWFFIDEFDLFMLTTIAVVLWRGPRVANGLVFPPRFRWLLAGFIASFLIALVIGLLPLSSLDANAFASYYSHYNALRAGKGFLWALVALTLIRYTVVNRETMLRHYTTGVLVGLGGVAVIVIWERFLFTGLLDFESVHRVAGLFSSMHTGGGHIEAYLVLTIPFTVAVLWLGKGRGWGVFAILLALIAVYSLFVTYSRGGYLGFLIGLGVLVACLLVRVRSIPRPELLVPLVLIMLVGIAYPAAKDSFVEKRFSTVSSDLEQRLSHWRTVLAARDSSWRGVIFGSGLGRYPEAYLFHSLPNNVLSTYAFREEDERRFLRLIGGSRLYMEQRIRVEPNEQYRLSLDVRSSSPNAGLKVYLCEKAMLYSYNCLGHSVSVPGGTGQWQHYELELSSGRIGRGPWYARRPTSLSLFNPGEGIQVDIDNITLHDGAGAQLIKNGAFNGGADHWFFTEDEHRPWHTENTWVQLLFEQGWLGAILFTSMVLYSLWSLLQRVIDGDRISAIFLASLVGFLVTGLVISPLDAPRIALLFFLTLLISQIRQPQ